MSASVTAYIGLGANLGDPATTLRSALRDLAELPHARLVRASRLYRTPAWGIEAQPDFVNAVAELRTQRQPRDLLQALFAIERAHGRDRNRETRWGPRTLDLDLLLHGQTMIDEPGLRVPHPYLHQRAFVLVPLAEIAPDLQLPGQGPVRNAVSALDASELSNIVAL